MKAVGTDIVAFMESDWPEGWYIDDGTLTCYSGKIANNDDIEIGLPLTDRYELDDFGFLASENGGTTPSLEAHFKKWKKSQTTETLAVQIPKEILGEVKIFFKANGCTVIK